MPGGGGIRLKYGNPMDIDDVAVDFPDMPIILAHPSFPWQDEAISVCLHKPQVYIDLSGWSPKYFSPTLVQYANTLLKHKVLFGSDGPLLHPALELHKITLLHLPAAQEALITGGNTRAAYALWVPAASGDYLLTPAHIDGSRPLQFFGSDYADRPTHNMPTDRSLGYDSVYMP